MEQRLKNQLQGFMATPPLWEGNYKGIGQFSLPESKFPEKLNINRELPSLATNYVLGKRMESFFRLLIKWSPHYQLISNNVQISRNKITLGELDFLLKDLQKNQVIHVELVYKFYVYDPSFNKEEERWIGPNRRDSFLQKLEKLQHKQFPLLYLPETKEFLQSLKLNPRDLIQQSCFKAKLFLPKQFLKKKLPLINQKSISGYWINIYEFNSLDYKDYQFFLPPKQDWPIAPEMAKTWIGFSEALKRIEEAFQRKKSPLLWMKKSETDFERFFVVWW